MAARTNDPAVKTGRQIEMRDALSSVLQSTKMLMNMRELKDALEDLMRPDRVEYHAAVLDKFSATLVVGRTVAKLAQGYFKRLIDKNKFNEMTANRTRTFGRGLHTKKEVRKLNLI